MKRGLVAAGAVALLLLTGCTGMQEQETSAAASDAPAGTTAPTPPAAIETPASPGPVEVTATTPPAKKTDDVLVGIQITVSRYVVVDAEQVKTAADYTCDQIDAGVDEDSIVALTGDDSERANATLVQMSADEYCGIR